ncbi:MAG: bis(5'-nucleosyl)-tetraphosphatase (symmetrical) YqeK [Phototrophicaceae bacterium]
MQASKRLNNLQQNLAPFSGNLAEDVPNFLIHHGFPKTAEHSRNVALKARELAEQFGVDADKAEMGGWLHDISAVFPTAERCVIAREFGLDVLPEEDHFPMIIHQKLSVVVARELFSVTDSDILSAIGCHTTLKKDASLLDKIVFVADKIAWDQVGTPPYLEDLLVGLDKSIDHASFVYLDYIWQMRDKLRVLHPWTAEAHSQLGKSLNL